MEQELTFIDKYGQKRKAILVRCVECETEFLTRCDQPGIYCSLGCRHKHSRKRANVKCANCGKDFERTISDLKLSKSKLYFCTRACKDKAQRIGGIKEIMPPHYGTASSKWTYREQFNKDELVCGRCGYSEFDCSVEIHHIDKDRCNNKKENLLPLCANCHKGLHTGKWQLSEIGVRA